MFRKQPLRPTLDDDGLNEKKVSRMKYGDDRNVKEMGGSRPGH